MTIHISGRGVTVSAALRRRVETKVDKVTRFLPKATEARVVVALERHRHLAEITLQAKGATLHAEAAAGDFHAALDVALESLEQQARRHKERVRARKPRAGRRGPPPAPAMLEESVPSEEEGPAVVVRRTSAKPMSVDEALEQVRVGRQSLLVFTNARSRRVNVLQRRSDGAFELVEPSG